MSDNIPFDIQVEIVRRLPIKSLIRFRSVSKPWKSLIDGSKFIADYGVPNSESQCLLVSYRDPANYEVKCVLIDDDDTFPQRKCSLNVPLFIKQIKEPKIIGSSHGLLCFYGYYREGNRGLRVVVLWNPSIQKSVAIKMPDELDSPYKTVFCFGVCPNTNDPKIVKINYIRLTAKWDSISCIPSQVEVFTLSSRTWRIPSRNLPRKSICFQSSHIVIDGVIYWIAFDRTKGDNFKVYRLIISFDLTSEEFREIYLPDYYLAQTNASPLSISKLRDSLFVINWGKTFLVHDVWMMEHGVPNSFTKLFTIDAPFGSIIRVLGFRKNGEPMLKTVDVIDTSARLKVYVPSSKLIKNLGIYGEMNSFFVSSYKETLLLLDQPDCDISSNL